MKFILKKILCILCLAALILSTVPLSAFASEWSESDFDLVTQRFFDDFHDQWDAYGLSNCNGYLDKLDFATGKFTDVNYDDIPAKATATASQHYTRLAVLMGSHLKGINFPRNGMSNVDILNLLVDAWYTHNPPPLDENGKSVSFPNSNWQSWWSDSIGQQQTLMAVVVMGENVLGEAQIEKLLEYLCDHMDMKKYPGYLTGTNLTWYTTQGIIDGLITHDYDKVKKSMDRTKQEIIIATDPAKEGIQADYSHHQHGSQYLNSYGTTFIVDPLEFFAKFRGTAFEDKEVYELLQERILEGYRWEKWGLNVSLNLAGRTISYTHSGPSTKDDSVAGVVKDLIEVYPEGRVEELQEFYDYLKASKGKYASAPPVVGNKYFWCSDYMVHNRSNYSVSELMVSDRTEVAEQSNNSNYKGQNVGFGSVFMSKAGDVQQGSPVLWDWTKIPGTTASDVLYTLKNGSRIWSQNSDFVGGVSNGTYGATAMELSYRMTEAKKAMFFFDDEYVSLGSGITSAENGVATTVDQRFRLGDLYVNGELKTEKGTTTHEDVTTVLQNNIGYVFPTATDVTIKDESVTGKWTDIEGTTTNDADITKDMFALWVDHGNTPKRQKYAYVTIPEITKENLTSYAANIPVTIVSNTDDLQAVYHKNLNVGAAVFYKKGTATIGDVTLTVSRPCIVMVKKTASGYEVSASNPKAEAATLNVELKTSSKTKSVTFDLPGSPQGGAEMGGSTVIKSVAM